VQRYNIFLKYAREMGKKIVHPTLLSEHNTPIKPKRNNSTSLNDVNSQERRINILNQNIISGNEQRWDD